MAQIPNVWNEPLTGQVFNSLRLEAERANRVAILPDNMKEWESKRQEIRNLIWKNAGVKYDNQLDLDLQITKTIQCDGYKVLCIHYQSRPGIRVTGNIYVPDGDGPFPAVLNVHGHWAEGRLAERVQSRGHSLAKNGFVCLAVDAWGSGERSTEHGVYTYHGGVVGGSLIPLGETLLGAQIVDNMRGVDLLCSLPYVDKANLGVTGASGGGNQTMWVAAMDDRLKAAMPVVSVGSFESYIMRANCVCELLPNGMTFTEEDAVLALVAPRAMKICNALQDSNPTFYVTEMLRSFTKAREIFKLYGVESQFTYQAFPLPHGYWPEVREAMLGFFDLHLKGKGHGQPRCEIPFKTLPEEEVMVFPKGTRPDTITSVVDYLRKNAAKAAPRAIDKNDADAEAEKAAALLGLKMPRFEQAWKHNTKDGWVCWSVSAENGRILPVLVHQAQNKDAQTAIIASPKGKSALSDSKLLQDALAKDMNVILFDPWGTGEIPDETNPRSSLPQFHAFSRALLWLGRTVIGEWTSDYMLMIQFAQVSLKLNNMVLGGVGEMAVAACFAAAYTQIAEVITEDMPESIAWRDGDNGTAAKASMALCIPNFVKWGDIATLINLLNAKGIPVK